MENKQITKEQFIVTATERLNKFTTKALKTEAIKLMQNTSNSASQVLDVVLDILMNRLPEVEFVEFCETL